MIISDIIQFLEEVAPLHLQEQYDNAGLLLGDLSWPVKGVLTSLDTTEEVVDEAIDLGCNLIVSHHPIIFSGLKRITPSHYIGRTVIKAIKNDIAIYAIHTNLDNILTNGVNEKIAQKLGLTNLEILAPKDQTAPDIGSGLIANIAEAMPTPLFVEHVKKSLDLKVIKHTALTDKKVQRVALCGGSGRFLLERAIAMSADVFISSDFKYHEYFEANDQICIMDIGHYESEKFTKELLSGLIQRKFSNFAPYCSKVNTNPINYK